MPPTINTTSQDPVPPHIAPQDPLDLPKEVRLELAYNDWNTSEGTLSIRKATRQYGLAKGALDRRIHGQATKKQDGEKRQRLTPEEEQAIATWILRLQAWGWPPWVKQTRSMAIELLLRKGDTKPLGVNWVQKFLSRHPDIKTQYIPPLDKERAIAQDPEVLIGWFQLFQQTLDTYQICKEDIYNMDEKGFMMGVVGKFRVVVSKHEKAYMTQCGNREWVSLIECISMDGRILAPWIIFKGKQHKKAWYEVLPEGGHIALSENGWTDNELGLAWIKQCFDPETQSVQKGPYRLLVLDGHASHITTEAIEYCNAHKIILLCLPPYTTHLLQPLDVGVFTPLAIAYKSRVQKATRLGASYSIDKTDFLELYIKARTEAITKDIIQKSWLASGLSPYNPEVVLQQLPRPP